MKLRWTSNGLAKGGTGRLYSVWAVKPLRSSEYPYSLTIWDDEHWREVCNSYRAKQSEVKALAQDIENGITTISFV